MWYAVLMDTDTQKILNTVAQAAASEAVAKLREFHQDDLKVLGERMSNGFEKVDRGIHEVNTRLDRVENALETLLQEFKQHQEIQRKLEAQIVQLQQRVQELEMQLARA